MESLISITIRYFYKIIYVNINKYCDVCMYLYVLSKKTLPNIDIQKKKKRHFVNNYSLLFLEPKLQTILTFS